MKSNDNQVSRYKRIGLIAIWIASLVFAGVWGHAQVVPKAPAVPMIISGSDLGFRVEGRKGQTVTGTFVVRIDGQWLPTSAAESVKPLISK